MGRRSACKIFGFPSPVKKNHGWRSRRTARLDFESALTRSGMISRAGKFFSPIAGKALEQDNKT